MKKNRPQNTKPEEEIGANLGNPFADIKFDIPLAPDPVPPPPPPPPPPPTREELMEAALSNADKKLLEVFRQKGASQISRAEQERSHGPVLKLVIQRKGHKGKTVTLVHGLQDFPVMERMQLCSDIKTALGIGARFVDAVLELQGDQRQRAAAWLQSQGYRSEAF